MFRLEQFNEIHGEHRTRAADVSHSLESLERWVPTTQLVELTAHVFVTMRRSNSYQVFSLESMRPLGCDQPETLTKGCYPRVDPPVINAAPRRKRVQPRGHSSDVPVSFQYYYQILYITQSCQLSSKPASKVYTLNSHATIEESCPYLLTTFPSS